MTYNLGQTVELAFTTAPAEVGTLVVTRPDATLAAATITGPAGTQVALLSLTQLGLWSYVWTAPNAGQRADTLVVGGAPGQSFARVDEIAARLGRTFTPSEQAQVQSLAVDATAHLQALIGQQVLTGTSTAVLHLAPGEQWLSLPQSPVRAVTQVRVGDLGSESTTSAWRLVDQQLHLGAGWSVGRQSGYIRVLVSFTHGLIEIPGDLRSWAIVLVSQALAQVEQGGTFGSAGLQSERIDDYAVNFATTGSGAEPFHIPPMAADQLRARYGAGAFVTGSR